MHINNRFKEFREILRLNQAQLGQHCGVKHGIISVYEKPENKIPEYIIIILELKFRLNRHWLLTGDGEMLLPEKEVEGIKLTMAAEASERYGKHKLREIATDLEQLSKRLRLEIEQKNTE